MPDIKKYDPKIITYTFFVVSCLQLLQSFVFSILKILFNINYMYKLTLCK
jgi:hypothetical protein